MYHDAVFKISENKVVLCSIAAKLDSISGGIIGKAMADKMTPKPLAKIISNYAVA